VRRRISDGRIPKSLAVTVAITLFCAGCGSSSKSSSTPPGPLTIAVFEPFSGPNAIFGAYDMAGCLPAVNLINHAGGVLGHSLKCAEVDTRGDPVDAVPAARQMLASTSNLVGILGPASDEASATVPILNQGKVVMFSNTGQAVFDRNKFPYFWRNQPGDDTGGYAMALFGHQRNFTRAAFIFGADISSQGTLPALAAAVPKLGATVVVNEKIAGGQTSYRSEIERLLAANPQVVYTEADPQTSATFFAQLKQLHGLLPIIGSNATSITSWFQPVSKAVGASVLSNAYAGGVAVDTASSGPAYAAYKESLFASHVPQPNTYITDPNAEARYDATNVMALAMTAAKSTDPSVYNQWIIRVTAARPGAKVVHTFAEGKAALAAGKQIQYVGPTGPEPFDRYHNSTGSFFILRYKPNGQTYTTSHFTAAQIGALAREAPASGG
jgi:ABC-type branched-subunit amino acid transport system substrate-binding protein